jgi:hypothetical protein
MYNTERRIVNFYNNYCEIDQNDKDSAWLNGNIDQIWKPQSGKCNLIQDDLQHLRLAKSDNKNELIHLKNVKFLFDHLYHTNLTYGYDCCNVACYDGGGKYAEGVLDGIFIEILNHLDIKSMYRAKNREGDNTELYPGQRGNISNNSNLDTSIISDVVDYENLFAKLDEKLGFRLVFPDIIGHQQKHITTSRGNITFRNLCGLYYMVYLNKILETFTELDKKDITVLEIGAGTGWTAYWAKYFNFKKYTIVDIPSTNIVQAHFLINSIGSNDVYLSGETKNNSAFVKIIPASEFKTLDSKYSIIVNFDGITEYGNATALNYLKESMSKTNLFFSINHETENGLSYTLKDIYTTIKEVDLVFRAKDNHRQDFCYYAELLRFL